jgi:hypothetical protein
MVYKGYYDGMEDQSWGSEFNKEEDSCFKIKGWRVKLRVKRVDFYIIQWKFIIIVLIS